MFTHFRSLYQTRRQRRCSLDAAASDLDCAERIPFYVLSFLLFGLPLILAPSLLTDSNALLWWMKGWTPVWMFVTGILYAAVYLPQAPAQVMSATVDAMERVEPEAKLVPVRERVESPYPFLLQVTADARRRETDVQSRVAARQCRGGRARRKRRLRAGAFPFLSFIPLFSSNRDSSA